ncbi:CDP-glycerol glycerophosphotransferase family protein [Peribacillus butanolivorans]|uniref:CDP-glycerol glycerophosphotransferase family protein n=1 Tax=Peribacillus butanolivorans TaxID=421767 RepID=UPI0035D65D0E
METINATSFNIYGSDVEIIIDANLELADIILKNNDTKEEWIYEGVKCKNLNDKTCLTIPLENMRRSEARRTTFTILLKVNEELFKLVKPTIKRKNKRSFARSFYQLSRTETAAIFLNKKNNLSLMYGNSSSVFRSLCKVVSETIQVTDIEVIGEKARFYHNEGELGNLFLTLYNSINQSFSAIGEVVSDKNVIDVDVAKLAEIPLESELYVEMKIGKVLKSYKVQFDSRLINQHNELAFIELNQVTDSLESYETLYFEELEVRQGQLLIQLKEPLCNPVSIVFEKSTSLEWLQTNQFKIDGQQLTIDLKTIFNNNFFKENQKWKLYVKEKISGEIQLSKFKPISKCKYLQLEQVPIEYVNFQANVYITPKAELAILLGKKEDVHNARFYVTKSRLSIYDMKFSNYELTFSIEDIQDTVIETAQLVLKNRKNGEVKKVVATTKKTSHHLEVQSDLHEFISSMVTPSRWDVSIEIMYANIMEVNRIGYYDQRKLSVEERYLPSVQTDEENVFTPYLTSRNELSFVYSSEFALRHEKLKSIVSIKNVVLNKSILEIEVMLSLPDVQNYTVKGMLLKHRNSQTYKHYPVNIEESVTSKINLDEHEFEQFYWDFYLLVEVEGEDYELKLRRPSRKVRKKMNRTIRDNSFQKEDDHVVYPYITRSNSLALTYRIKSTYEAPSFKRKEKIAYYVYKMFKKYYEQKNIWLVYEKLSETAQDNGYHFFKYCYNNKPERNVYYIIKKDSPDLVNLKGFEDKVIYFMSLKHLVYLFAAKLLIASETKGHAYVWRVQKGKVMEYLRRKRIVFLQHGVLGLKKIDSTLNKGSSEEVDLFVVSSDFEKEIVKKYFGYNERDIIVTGLSRWDDINKEETKVKQQIFLMPTWRNWLNEVSNEEFIESNYFKNYIGLLNSEKLLDLLRKYEVDLKFYVHPKFQPFIDQFHTTIDQVEIIKFGDVNISTLIRESALLITDYSSIAWDMYYLEKPTIFYQFDLDEYTELQGSYMDMNKELFGDQALTIDELLTYIENSIRNNFKEQDMFKEKRSHYFANIDNQNSERIYSSILINERRLKPRRVSFYKKLTKVPLLRKIWRWAKRREMTRKFAFLLRNQLMNLNERRIRLWNKKK